MGGGHGGKARRSPLMMVVVVVGGGWGGSVQHTHPPNQLMHLDLNRLNNTHVCVSSAR